MTPDPTYFPGATPRDLLAGVLDWTDRHPDDPRLPEVLVAAIRRTLTAPTPAAHGDAPPHAPTGCGHEGEAPAGLTRAEIADLQAKAEAALKTMHGATLTRYDHGGGRLAVWDGDERHLVADFYHRDEREFIAAAHPQAVLALLAAHDALAARLVDTEWRVAFWKDHEDAQRERADAAEARVAALAGALTEARQYVADAGSDEDGETQRHSTALLAEIDAHLAPPPAAAGPADGGGRGC